MPIYGAINILYKDTKHGREFLVVKNTKTGNTTFVSGAQEPEDSSLTATAQRELSEELGLSPGTYMLKHIPVKQEFTFSSKPERAGKRGEYSVFLIDATHTPLAPTRELSGVTWASEEEVLKLVTFDDLKAVFRKSLKYLR